MKQTSCFLQGNIHVRKLANKQTIYAKKKFSKSVPSAGVRGGDAG